MKSFEERRIEDKDFVNSTNLDMDKREYRELMAPMLRYIYKSMYAEAMEDYRESEMLRALVDHLVTNATIGMSFAKGTDRLQLFLLIDDEYLGDFECARDFKTIIDYEGCAQDNFVDEDHCQEMEELRDGLLAEAKRFTDLIERHRFKRKQQENKD